jgi:hypothetical protein
MFKKREANSIAVTVDELEAKVVALEQIQMSAHFIEQSLPKCFMLEVVLT